MEDSAAHKSQHSRRDECADAEFTHRRFEEVWNNKREDAIDEMFAEDRIATGLNDADSNPLRGPEGFKTLHRAFLSAYPDLKIEVVDTVVEGDKIAARSRAKIFPLRDNPREGLETLIALIKEPAQSSRL